MILTLSMGSMYFGEKISPHSHRNDFDKLSDNS